MKFLSMCCLLFAGCFSLLEASAADTPVLPKSPSAAVSIQADTAEIKGPATLVGDKININTASALELSQRLDGIGEVKALAIVKHRDAYGPFSSVDELLEVKGIGLATLDKNRARLRVR